MEKTNKKYNWGIIGAGNIAKRFIKGLVYQQDSTLYAVSCRTMEKALAFKEESNALIAYDSFDDAINDDKVDIVYIALPHNLHYEYIIKAINNHKHVLCEKPITMSPNQILEIKELAYKNNVFVMEALKSRFVPGYLKLKELLNENIIGDIKHIENRFCFKNEFDPNKYHFQKGVGGCLYDLAPYNISFIFDILNSNNYSNLSTSTTIKEDIDVDSQNTFTINNVDCFFHCSFLENKGSDAIIEGTKGTIKIPTMHRINQIEIIKDNKSEVLDIPYLNDDFYTELDHVIQCLKDNKKESPIMSLDDSYKIALLIQDIKNKL